jgi:hypothetical protein
LRIKTFEIEKNNKNISEKQAESTRLDVIHEWKQIISTGAK